jgi:hypothetical protein
MVATLTGSEIKAQASMDCCPAFPELGRLPDFLAAAANIPAGRKAGWTELGEDFRLEAEGKDGASVLLRVYLGSTSDDACFWLVHATLEVSRGDLRAGAEAARAFA